jgi:autotransporter-associated beta strand protein
VPQDLNLSIEDAGLDNQSDSTQTFVANTGIIQVDYSYVKGPVQFISEPQTAVDGNTSIVWMGYRTRPGSRTSFINLGGVIPGTHGGQTGFYEANAGSAQITNKAAEVSGAFGGLTMFWVTSHGANAIVTSEGATVAGAGGGITQFIDLSGAGRATLIALGGSNGGSGGTIQFQNNSDGLGSRVEIFGNATLDISAHYGGVVSVGSLQGDGLVLLGNNTLSVGDTNASTTFSGNIDGSGSLFKVGSGIVTLTGANTYLGGTIVKSGVLRVSNSSGSATGDGTLKVAHGTLGGGGIITGPVLIGNGTSTDAVLGPSVSASVPKTLKLRNRLTFMPGSTYNYQVNTNKGEADKVIANGITIASDTQFVLSAVADKKLSAGIVFTAINNTSGKPISGTFQNLEEGSIITLGQNSYQASYSGGDGNDLTLTVVP